METVIAMFGRLLHALRNRHRRATNELIQDPTARLRPGIGFVFGSFNVILAVYFGGAIYFRLIRGIAPAPVAFIALALAGMTVSVLAIVIGVTMQFIKARRQQWLFVIAIILLTTVSMTALIVAGQIVQAS